METILGQTLWILAFYFCISVMLLFLGWILYYNIIGMHILPGISQRTKLRLLCLFMRIVFGLATILDKLGICHEFVIWTLLMNGIPPRKPSDLIVKEMLFDRVPVMVCCSKRASPENRRGLVWIHGGAGLFGSPRAYRRLCNLIASKTDTVVACIGYPLAPEHPYPAQQLSCYAAVSHFLKNALDYGVDPKRIVLAGDSSGGTLVASTAQQLLMTKDLPQPRAHILIYPFLQGLDLNLPSYQQKQYIPLLVKKEAVRLGAIYLLGTSAGVNEIMANAHVPQELMAKYQKWISAEHIPEEFKGRGYVPFVPGPFSEDLFKKCKSLFDPIFSPLLAEDAVIQQFPETFLLTCEYDIFRDDGLLYKKRLEDNGVPVTWCHLKDGFHGITLVINVVSTLFPVRTVVLGNIKLVEKVEHDSTRKQQPIASHQQSNQPMGRHHIIATDRIAQSEYR